MGSFLNVSLTYWFETAQVYGAACIVGLVNLAPALRVMYYGCSFTTWSDGEDSAGGMASLRDNGAVLPWRRWWRDRSGRARGRAGQLNTSDFTRI
jgi:hypothetical protein